ncbi:MAG: hypothetical protein Q7S40_03730 [Opitutaceae bacterium]|nr:hypothetical protein [Opitutaceae bacterium]
MFLFGWAPPVPAQTTDEEKKAAAAQAAVELSPFLVQENTEQGYYSSQTLAGGRLRQDIKDLGTSIQVITKEFMDDLGVTGVEELFQYTTSTEVAGILGNFTGASDNSDGEVNTGDARRNPDATTRVRGLSAPDRTRNFFKSDIPFDSYNTDRVDINRGANSFLFGLGSPSGLVNTGMVKARFRDTNEIVTRIGSGGKNPSYRGSFNLNRVLIKDTLAVHGAALTDRTQYRQEPTYKDDDRLYGALTYRPFKNADTIISAYVERGKIDGNAPDVMLPQQNLGVFLDDPVVGRVSINAYDNLQRFNHVEGPTQAQWNALSAAEKARYRVRDLPAPASLANANWGNGAYGLVYDGRNGAMPTFAYTDQMRAADYGVRDPFFGPNRTGKGAINGVYHGNIQQIKGTGWLSQGFTDLETFDFSRSNLAWDNDYYTRDFVNYSVALEQVFWRGKAGFEVAFDYQDLFRRDHTAFNGGNAEVMFDINEKLWLPTDPNYRTSGIVAPQANPNYGRPFIMFKAAWRTTDSQREAGRFTGFVKYDFAEKLGQRRIAKLLGRHTLTGLVDGSTHDEKVINYVLNSFGDPEPALHIGPPNARQTGNAARNVPIYAYVGPPQPQAFTDPNFQMGDFRLEPAKFQLRPPPDYSIQKLSWNLGPDANAANVGLNSRINGNEGFVLGTFEPRAVPNKNYRLQQTRVQSYAVNSQSFFWDNLLVVNTGYRQDIVRTRLNTEAPLIGLDEISDVTPEGWRLENGNFLKIKSDVFGYGGVVNWPRQWFELPAKANVSVHYNTSENFVPDTTRVDQFRRPIESPTGKSEDYGVTVQFWDHKVVARFNWFKATLSGAGANISGTFNPIMRNMFTHYGNLNADIRRFDANDDGAIDASFLEEIAVNPATGLTPEGLTREQAVAALYPNLAQAKAARAAIEPHLTDELKTAFNARSQPDGSVETQAAGTITDTSDIVSKGFEAELIFNPSRNWRIAFNAASQETILTNIAPRLTGVLDTVWLPHLAQYGDLDWNTPVETVSGNTTSQQINGNLLEYWAAKGQEGRPQAEQRKWRVNAIARYLFSEGRLRGVSIGGAVRWEDQYAAGYPQLDDSRGLILPDVRNPYLVEAELSYDLSLGYRRKILSNKDWTAQLNVRNLQNLGSDKVTAVRFQPDGSIARVRFDPPFQVLLTNTFRF